MSGKVGNLRWITPTLVTACLAILTYIATGQQQLNAKVDSILDRANSYTDKRMAEHEKSVQPFVSEFVEHRKAISDHSGEIQAIKIRLSITGDTRRRHAYEVSENPQNPRVRGQP